MAGDGLSCRTAARIAWPRATASSTARAPRRTTLVAGDRGLDVLAFGEGSDTGITWLPRAGAWWLGPRWLPDDGPNPFVREARAGPLELPAPEAERPPAIVALAAVETEVLDAASTG